MQEYKESGSVEEIADILEVLQGLVEQVHGMKWEDVREGTSGPQEGRTWRFTQGDRIGACGRIRNFGFHLSLTILLFHGARYLFARRRFLDRGSIPLASTNHICQ